MDAAYNSWRAAWRRKDLEVAQPVLIRTPLYGNLTSCRLPCGDSAGSLMRMLVSKGGAYTSDELKQSTLLLTLTWERYKRLVQHATTWQDRYNFGSVYWLRKPSAGLRAYRAAASIVQRCAPVPWPQHRKDKALLLQRMRERHVPHVVTDIALLVARTWMASSEVQYALAEVRGSEQTRIRAAKRDREAKAQKRRGMKRKRKGCS